MGGLSEGMGPRGALSSGVAEAEALRCEGVALMAEGAVVQAARDATTLMAASVVVTTGHVFPTTDLRAVHTSTH
jgi:hypothetical protein